jgi:hypothetical protein
VEILDPLNRDIREELRQLRRSSTSFDEASVSTCVALVTCLGMGSAAQAFSSLLAICQKYGKEVEGDVRAFFEISGHGITGDTLDRRLANYAQAHSVDPRTGLRRSNRGIDRLAALIRDGLPFERPWGNVIVTQSGALVEGQIRINVELGMTVSRPRVWTNGAEVENLSFSFREAAYSERMLSATELIPPTDLDADVRGDAALFALRIVWNMPVWPQWYVGAQLADPRLMSVLSTNRNFETDIAVNWAYPSDDPRRGSAPFAKSPILK